MDVLVSRQLDDYYLFSYPFLKCPDTIAHLKTTKVIFLMRGLPGSGKSTLVQALKNIYSTSVAVCSADHYFLDDNGVYHFNPSKISNAHLACQQKAEEACRNNILTVIIDNTNIRMDECKKYFQIASHHGYLVIIVEPRTNWKRDGNTLNALNTHSVPIEVIEGRLRQYHPLIPFYYGLFLNEKQSNDILKQAFEYYQKALELIPQLKSDLESVSRAKHIPLNNLLSRTNMKTTLKVLHCTMKYIGRITDESREDFMNYASNRMISHSIGKMCRGYVVGFIITPRTLGARIYFPDRHTWALWAQDDNETMNKAIAAEIDNRKAQTGRRNTKSKGNKTKQPVTTNDDVDTHMARSIADGLVLVDKTVKKDEPVKGSFFRPTFGFMSRAHFTCAVAPDISAAQTGLDTIEMIKKEGDALENDTPIPEADYKKAVMKYFGYGECIIYLKCPIPFETIFSGHFN